jgi:hypothetical protein
MAAGGVGVGVDVAELVEVVELGHKAGGAAQGVPGGVQMLMHGMQQTCPAEHIAKPHGTWKLLTQTGRPKWISQCMLEDKGKAVLLA